MVHVDEDGVGSRGHGQDTAGVARLFSRPALALSLSSPPSLSLSPSLDGVLASMRAFA